MFRGIRQYLTEAWSELKKVAWPTRQTVINLTLIVLAVSIAVQTLYGDRFRALLRRLLG